MPIPDQQRITDVLRSIRDDGGWRLIPRHRERSDAIQRQPPYRAAEAEGGRGAARPTRSGEAPSLPQPFGPRDDGRARAAAGALEPVQ